MVDRRQLLELRESPNHPTNCVFVFLPFVWGGSETARGVLSPAAGVLPWSGGGVSALRGSDSLRCPQVAITSRTRDAERVLRLFETVVRARRTAAHVSLLVRAANGGCFGEAHHQR